MSESDRPRDVTPDDLPELSLPQWRSLVDDLASFPGHVRERGMIYAREGRVGTMAASEERLSAEVRGTRMYRTSWTWDGELWHPHCTCKAGPYCKHAYALACAALDQARAALGAFDRRLGRLLPADVPQPEPETTTLRLGPDSFAAPEPSRRAPDRPVLRARPGRRAVVSEAESDPDTPAILKDLMRAPTSWSRASVLDRLMEDAPQDVDLNPWVTPFSRILEEPDPELLLWRLAQEIPRFADGWLPPSLAPWRERDDLAARHAERELPVIEQELMQWAEERTGAGERSLRVVLRLERGEQGEPELSSEVRLTSQRLVDVPRSLQQLSQLHGELKRRPAMLTTAEAALLRAVLDTQTAIAQQVVLHGSTVSLMRLLKAVGPSPLVRWADDVDGELARRGEVAPGGVVHASAELLRLTPVAAEHDGAPRIELKVEWPDGRTRPLAEVLYFRSRNVYGDTSPGLVLASGAFHELLEEPSLELVDRFRRHGGLPVRDEQRDRMLAQLAEAFPGMRASLAPHTRWHAVTPAVTLDLRDNDWLQIRVFAHTAGRGTHPGAPRTADTAWFEYTPERRWERLASSRRSAETRDAFGAVEDAAAGVPGAPPPPSGAAAAPVESSGTLWLEAPDASRVAPVLEWLRATGVRSGAGARGPGNANPREEDRDTGWWIRLGPRNANLIAGAWERRPADVDWFGNPAMRRLLARPRTARPRIRVKHHGVDWFQLSAEWEAEGLALSSEDLARLRAADTQWVKLSTGWTNRDTIELHDRTLEVFADLGIDPAGGDQRVTLWQLVSARPESLAALEEMGADPEAMRALERVRAEVAAFRGLPPVAVPGGFIGELRPYQKEGLDFLAWTATTGLGAILADDMGLGKTIQALAWMLHLRDTEPGIGPCLVVCPTSVMHNWEREAARFSPSLRVLMLRSGSERHELRREIPGHDLVITNYALLRRDLDAWRTTTLGAVILDEAQNVKNPDTAISRAVRELQPRHRLALTGTPLENRALDLWSIMEFLNPGYLGGRSRFEQVYDRLDAPPHARALLSSKLRPVLLRRLKREVAKELPDRIEERRDCEMTTGQRQLYLDELTKGRHLVMSMAANPDALRKNKLSILTVLTRLRQICCHPVLAGGAAQVGSGKFDALFELLEPLLAEGHKVLVFSQFVTCLDLIAVEMDQRGIPYHVLTGETTKREEVVTAFQDDPRPCVFLLSLRAGGTGLNLTAASYVVLFDPWWNPAVEAQAIDRTHRIGQDRTVIAYRLVAEGTIEEKIWELQQKKAALVKDVLGEEGFARTLNHEDLEYLLAEV